MLYKMTTTIRHNDTDVHAVIKQCESGCTYVVVFCDNKKMFEYSKKGYDLDNLKFMIDQNLLSQIKMN